MADIEPGIYEHYKGNRYRVLGTGEHTETGETFVIYMPLYTPETTYWIRPLGMFQETVAVDGLRKSRFAKVEDEQQ